MEVAERFADGLASEAELEDARAALFGGDRGSQVLQDMSAALSDFEPFVGAEVSAEPDKGIEDIWPASVGQRFMEAVNESARFSRAQGVMHRAAYAAVDGSWLVSREITHHLDEPDLLRERTAHADLVRQFFGSPFR